MISYAQNFEDVMLARVFSGGEPGFYVDIGAMDPELDSVTKHFYDRGWRGVNAEPTPGFHAKLSRARPRDINLCIAVGHHREIREFHDSDGHGISTFSGDLVQHFATLKYSFQKRYVQVMPLREIFERYCPEQVDFLKVDVEGSELEVLESGDWTLCRPRIVLVEAVTADTHQPCWQPWEPLLLKNNYLFAYFDGLNRFYVRLEDKHLARHFSSPPNVFDGFESAELHRLRREQCPPPLSDGRKQATTTLWIRSADLDRVIWRRLLSISGRPRSLLHAGWRALLASGRRMVRLIGR